jgi:hypothetical protein
MLLSQNKEQVVAHLVVGWEYDHPNWDHDGASPTNTKSLQMAIDFVCLLDDDSLMPEPMFHSSGTVGLFWSAPELYADLEFFENGTVAYYIECNGSKMKGVVEFNQYSSPYTSFLLHTLNPLIE